MAPKQRSDDEVSLLISSDEYDLLLDLLEAVITAGGSSVSEISDYVKLYDKLTKDDD